MNPYLCKNFIYAGDNNSESMGETMDCSIKVLRRWSHCGSHTSEWFPMIPTSWYSHSCVVLSHTGAQLVCVTNSIWHSRQNISKVRLWIYCNFHPEFSPSFFPLSLSFLALEKAGSHIVHSPPERFAWEGFKASSQSSVRNWGLPTIMWMCLESDFPGCEVTATLANGLPETWSEPPS